MKDEVEIQKLVFKRITEDKLNDQQFALFTEEGKLLENQMKSTLVSTPDSIPKIIVEFQCLNYKDAGIKVVGD